MNRFYSFLILFAVVFVCSCNPQKTEEKALEPIVLAYVFSPRAMVDVDPTYVTHINFAFGHVNDCFNGIRIANEELLVNIVALKQQKPELKILLSIGGWGSGNFSEMAAEEYLRKAFAVDCKRVIDQFGLDGIDIDWEYPTTGMAGISYSPDDDKNFVLLCREIRNQIGWDKLLTYASANNARYVLWEETMPYMDFVNVMSYDLENKRAGEAPMHHSPLFLSDLTHGQSTDCGIKAHLDAGIPAHQLVLGIHFANKGLLSRDQRPNWWNLDPNSDVYTIQWDDVAKASWLSGKEGDFLQTFECPRSIAYKAEYVQNMGLRGAMYWQYTSDNSEGRQLVRAVYEEVMKRLR